MKRIVTISRYLLAVVFIFSGFVKGIDPLGLAYKFHDYFIAFHLNLLEPLSLVFSYLLCAVELLVGLLLLFGVKPRLAAWGALIFMAIFTPLTLVLALFNPVSDCGCFGDAIHLSNWQTFFKNIAFLAAALVLFFHRGMLCASYSKAREPILLVLLVAVSFLPSIHGYRHLPAIDFRPYHIGVNIQHDMVIPDGAASDEYRTVLYYKKDGTVKEFDESSYPWDDSTWTFVDSKSTLVKKGYTPPISNFSLSTTDGQDITERVVSSNGYLFFVVAPRLDNSNTSSFKRLTELYFKASSLRYGYICATSSPKDQIDAFTREHAIPFPVVNADEVTLKTIIRSNPGLLLLYNGTIVGKWHWRDLPNSAFVDEAMLSRQISGIMQKSHTQLAVSLSLVLILLFVFAVKFKGKCS